MFGKYVSFCELTHFNMSTVSDRRAFHMGHLWRPRHWNLLENRRTPLIRAHMRQQPQNVLECACEGASARFPANQYLESAPCLTNQIAAATFVYSPIRCSWGHTQTYFPCRLLASRFTCWSGVSLIPLSLARSYTSVLVTVNTQYLSSHRLSFLSQGAKLILETTRGYCWGLVFLGL